MVPYSFTASKSVTQSRGAAYTHTDCDVVLNNSTDYYYKLEGIDLDNSRDNPFYGPIGPVTETVGASQFDKSSTKSKSGGGCFIESLYQH